MRHRTLDLRERESKQLPPEKLLNILRQLYPKELADEKYAELTGIVPTDETDKEVDTDV